MPSNVKRTYMLANYTVELRGKGWFYWPTYGEKTDAKGPYSSIVSVSLMIARQLGREIKKRDGVHELAT